MFTVSSTSTHSPREVPRIFPITKVLESSDRILVEHFAYVNN